MSLIDAFITTGDEKTIAIACEGSMTVDLDELAEMQTYKDLTDRAYEKAKTSILTLGFSFPIFVWEQDTIKWIIDAHQRKRVLTRMRDTEGFVIPPLPAVRIFAKDKIEAKKKILAQESQYGAITEEGLHEFMNEEDAVLDPGEIETFTIIDEFELEYSPKEEEEGANENNSKDTCIICQNYHATNHQTA